MLRLRNLLGVVVFVGLVAGTQSPASAGSYQGLAVPAQPGHSNIGATGNDD